MDVQQQLHVISHIEGRWMPGARGSVVTNETAYDPPKWAFLSGWANLLRLLYHYLDKFRGHVVGGADRRSTRE